MTVFADLTVAVEVGMILAALVFIRKVTSTTTVSQVTEEYLREGYAHILQDKEFPAYVTIFRIHGPFLFGATDKIEEILAHFRIAANCNSAASEYDRDRRHGSASAGESCGHGP